MKESSRLAVAGVPTLSICMPVYNGSRFLESAFSSLASQTFQDFEIILVDDGSRDDSAQLAEQLMRQYRLNGKVLRITNRGCEQARDLACEHASAQIIAPFDCDDIWEPKYLEEMVGVLRSNDQIDLVYCDFYEESATSNESTLKSMMVPWVDLSLATRHQYVYQFPPGKFFDLLLQGQVLFPPCTMFRRRIYVAAGKYAATLPELRISLDWSFGLRASRLGVIAFLHRPLLHKRGHDGNTSGDLLKTASSDVVVLESILADKTLTAQQRKLASARAATRAVEAGYCAWAGHGQSVAARGFFMKSLGFSWSTRAARLLLFTFIPLSVVTKIRSIRFAMSPHGPR